MYASCHLSHKSTDYNKRRFLDTYVFCLLFFFFFYPFLFSKRTKQSCYLHLNTNKLCELDGKWLNELAVLRHHHKQWSPLLTLTAEQMEKKNSFITVFLAKKDVYLLLNIRHSSWTYCGWHDWLNADHRHDRDSQRQVISQWTVWYLLKTPISFKIHYLVLFRHWATALFMSLHGWCKP